MIDSCATHETATASMPGRQRIQPPGTGAAGRLRALRQRCLARAAAPVYGLLGARCRDSLGILMYHRVAPVVRGAAPPTWNVSPQRFRTQLAGLLKRGFEAWPLQRVLEHRADGRPIPRKAFVVTFDDGYQCVLHRALPILLELRIPATVFLATAYLDADGPFPADDWQEAGSSRVPADSWKVLSTSECRALLDSGLIELGTHTHTHGDFRGRPHALRAELETSISILRDRFGLTDVPFAFPYGTVHLGFAAAPLIEAARRAGTSCALTTESMPAKLAADPFGWGRFTAESWDSASTLAGKLGGWFSWPREMRQRRRGGCANRVQTPEGLRTAAGRDDAGRTSATIAGACRQGAAT